jgi:hypothetical protein
LLRYNLLSTVGTAGKMGTPLPVAWWNHEGRFGGRLRGTSGILCYRENLEWLIVWHMKNQANQDQDQNQNWNEAVWFAKWLAMANHDRA